MPVQVSAFTASVLSGPEPQVLFAFTERVPPPEEVVTEIELLVEVPLHPEGMVHV